MKKKQTIEIQTEIKEKGIVKKYTTIETLSFCPPL